MNTTLDPILARLQPCLAHVPLPEDLDTPLAALALDSMDTVELLCVIHAEFGVRLTEAEFFPQQTFGGLLQAIESKSTQP